MGDRLFFIELLLCAYDEWTQLTTVARASDSLAFLHA